MDYVNNIFVTGGAGFIGSNFILDYLSSDCVNLNGKVINFDKLTYAGNLSNLRLVENHPNYIFKRGDICNKSLVRELFEEFRPKFIINFAAESHVDRSIYEPQDFIETNVVGTYHLLESAREYWGGLDESQKKVFRFLHVSTDEVYGSLEKTDLAFNEMNRYEPNSPYSASKAASDHLVRAWHHTYGFPVLTTNCSNNYGPYHFPEKLIPLCILNALNNKLLPIYGDGLQVRDWLYVKDHCSAIRAVLNKGEVGETYNVGGGNEKTNLEVVHLLCEILDELRPNSNGKSYKEQIIFIKDRPGHDRRYAIDATKLERELGWKPQETFETGLRKTVEWYLKNQDWVSHVLSGEYQQWLAKQYI